jgi:hypothetical protein
LSALIPSPPRDEVGPVHCYDDFLALADDVLHPRREQLPDIDAWVAQQPVDLFDGVFVGFAPRLRQAMTDDRHRERGAGRHTQSGIGKRQHTLDVQIAPKHAVDKFPNGFNTIDQGAHRFPRGWFVIQTRVGISFQAFVSPSKMRGFLRMGPSETRKES